MSHYENLAARAFLIPADGSVFNGLFTSYRPRHVLAVNVAHQRGSEGDERSDHAPFALGRGLDGCHHCPNCFRTERRVFGPAHAMGLGCDSSQHDSMNTSQPMPPRMKQDDMRKPVFLGIFAGVGLCEWLSRQHKKAGRGFRKKNLTRPSQQIKLWNRRRAAWSNKRMNNLV
ncbi:MAG: hypothetical protein QOF48_2278, partial [Verrucomicrobiota bacterium]